MKLVIKTVVFLAIFNVIAFYLGDSLAGLIFLGSLLALAVAVLIIIFLGLIELGAFKSPQEGYNIARYGTINVWYRWGLNGGGIILAHEFVRLVATKIGKRSHVYEYCAGPGFIGFNLLAQGLCDRLTLSDVNPQAVAAIEETIKRNNLQDKVKVYLSDGLKGIPEGEKWDLVVGNPPWVLNSKRKLDIRVGDYRNQVHEGFFQGIKEHLNPQAEILFVEGEEYTRANQFKGMTERNGLAVTESFKGASFLNVFSNTMSYKGAGWPLIIFLRFGMALREVYFLRISVQVKQEQ